MKETRSWGIVRNSKTTVKPDGGFGVPLGTFTIGYFLLAIDFLHGNDFVILYFFETNLVD